MGEGNLIVKNQMETPDNFHYYYFCCLRIIGNSNKRQHGSIQKL